MIEQEVTCEGDLFLCVMIFGQPLWNFAITTTSIRFFKADSSRWDTPTSFIRIPQFLIPPS